VFNIPTTIIAVETEGFSGHTYPGLLAVFPEHKILERSSMNSWDDQNVRDALAAAGRKKVIVSGNWTEVCNATFALSAALEGGYEIYIVADANPFSRAVVKTPRARARPSIEPRAYIWPPLCFVQE
jgi:nicotinamidase-related amidase